jgi:ribosomal protein S18 acetylase RimI-like enzyme
MDVRPYRPGDPDEVAGLWTLKRGFELGLGSDTGDDGKRATYEGKLTDEYRERWLGWVDRCVAEEERCVVVAEADGGGDDRGSGLVGYAFLLPESFAFVWDAAVLNELYVVPDRRGTGVADDLLTAVVETAREQSLPLDRLVLDVDGTNERARAFYDRHGFERWGEMVARGL